MPHHISLKGIVSSGWWRVTTQYKGLFERSPCNYIVHGWLYAGPLMHNESGMLLVCCNTSVGLRSYLSAGNRGTRIFVYYFMVTCLLKKRIVHEIQHVSMTWCPGPTWAGWFFDKVHTILSSLTCPFFILKLQSNKICGRGLGWLGFYVDMYVTLVQAGAGKLPNL